VREEDKEHTAVLRFYRERSGATEKNNSKQEEELNLVNENNYTFSFSEQNGHLLF
jgi:hypothetical protein